MADRGTASNDVIGHAAYYAILLDCSTIDVADGAMTNVQRLMHGYEMVDAPVSGGIGAGGIALHLLWSCSARLKRRTNPVKAMWVRRRDPRRRCGRWPRPKSVNNMLPSVIHMIGTAEASSPWRRSSALIRRQTFYDISSVSSARNWSMTSYVCSRRVGPQSPADNGYEGGFATR
jgi:3-hydroxyisobutyrate dehydrogenase